MTMNTTSMTRAVASAAAGGQGEQVVSDRKRRAPDSAAARLSRELLSDEAIDRVLAGPVRTACG